MMQPEATRPELGPRMAGLGAVTSGETADRIGELVAGFRITQRIAEDPRTLLYGVERGSERAYLRVLRSSLSQDPSVAMRFVASAKLLRRMRFPGLARILEAGTLPDGCAYVLVQPAPGELLSERLRRGESLAPLAPALGPIAKGLAMLHAQGLYYLGIEPEHVQVPEGTAPALQLLDSEYARSAAMQLLPPAIASLPVRDGVDPVLFMAPEMFRDGAEVGPPADVYALGALAYLMLCGRPPLPAGSTGEVIAAHLSQAPAPVRSVAPNVPDELARLIEAMLDKDPGRRPSMAAVAKQWPSFVIAPIAAPPQPRPPVLPPQPPKPPPSEPAIVQPPRLEPPIVQPPRLEPPIVQPRFTPIPPQPRTEGYATVALVTGLFGMGLIAIIFGLLAKKRIRESGGALTGDGMATAGLVLGIVWILVWFTCWSSISSSM